MKRANLTVFVAVALLAGCGSESHQDLREWMAAQGKDVKGRLDPLPTIRPYEPFTYNAFDLPDPFKPRKIEPNKSASKLAPDLTRRCEPLESFPLESLSMVGTIEKGRALYALVKIAFAAVWNRSAEYISFRPTSVAVMAPTLQIPDAYLVRSRGATGGHGIAGVDAMPGCDANASDALCKQFLKKTSRS